MTKTSKLLLLLALVASALVPTRPAAGAFPGANGVIAYTAYLGTNADICVVDPDGSDPRKLVTAEGDQAQPAWSPDGTKLAYVDFSGAEAAHIKVLDLGTGMTTDLGPGVMPAWSSTGDQLAFADNGLWIMDADGTDRRQIDSGYSSHPAWSPDGSQIAFYDDTRDGMVDEGGVWLISPEGGEPQRISDGGPADWSPDGSQLVVDGGYWQLVIYIVDRDGGDQRTIAQSNDPVRERFQDAAWSPDGSTIVYSRTAEGRDRARTDLWVEPVEGGEARPLFVSPNPEFEPDWQPLGPRPVPVEGEGACQYELHARSVTLNLRRHLVARGRVMSVDGTAACAGGWVRIDRRTRDGWQTAGSTTPTDNEGRYRIELIDRPGRYRATVTGDAQCRVARSIVHVHRH